MDIETLSSCNLCDSIKIEPIDPKCNIQKCDSCGYIFDNPRPTLNDISAYYFKPHQRGSERFPLDKASKENENIQ